MFVYPQDQVSLALAMLRSGIPRAQVRRATGISCSTLTRWLSGKTPRQPDPHPERMPEAAWPDYAYLLGLYLGDGYVAKAPRDVYRLDLTFDSTYPGIIRQAVRAVSIVRPENRVSVRSCRDAAAVIVGCYSKAWPVLLPQHGVGVKHERRIVLEPWQEQITEPHAKWLIRGLIHSDGCRFIARQRTHGKMYPYARYEFANRSIDIINIFSSHLTLLGVAHTIHDRGAQQRASHVQIARKEAVALLDSFVGPKY
jgi:hypothetical protein